MLALVQKFNQKTIDSLKKDVDSFNVGDSVIVGLKIVDGAATRTQEFKGVCIAKRNKGLASSAVIRKITDDIEIERDILIYSPMVEYIKLVSSGEVRRAKLYYLKGRIGKSGRIKAKKYKPANKDAL